MNEKKLKIITSRKSARFFYSFFWFFIGFFFSAIFIISFISIYFQYRYADMSIPGIFIDNVYVGEKTGPQVEKIFEGKNFEIGKKTITFTYENLTATKSAEELKIGYNSKLLSYQALSIGKTSDILTNLNLVITAISNGIFLPPSYMVDETNLRETLQPIQKQIFIEPVDALFTVRDNKVVAFKESSDGKTIDFEKLQYFIQKDTILNLKNSQQNILVEIPIKKLKSNKTTEEVNNLGIVEIIGQGKSNFSGSIINRIHNLTLATSKINGLLIAPDETFSFNLALGDVSKYTGYKEAYIIKDGKTILGDGGGVCQVSTTLFRALLNAGLPILERHAHAYRVGYYEHDSAPGLDATVYDPTADLKFKNDTKNHILIQAFADQSSDTLTFVLYGKKDNREVNITNPVITNQTPAPSPIYQDDPNLLKGVIKQIDYEAKGAKVTFSRTVKKDGKILISETYTSNYLPWHAIFLRGIKE